MAVSRTGDGPSTHWDGLYDRLGEKEVSWFEPAPRCSVELLDDLGVTPSSSVIDVGAGASRLVDVLLGRGFSDLTVLDVSELGLTQTRRRLGTTADVLAHWVVADVLVWRPERRFDVWHDRAMFHFLTDPADVQRYREVLTAAIRPGGVVIIGTFAADAPSHCSGLEVARYSADQLAATLGDGLEVVASRREEHQTPSGGVQPFTWMVFGSYGGSEPSARSPRA